MNIREPIIIIGAGRSGTTLLTRIFRQHPDIDFKGETSFLVPRLWLELWEDRFWFNWQIYVGNNPRSSREIFPDVSADVLRKVQRRVGGVIANGVTDLLEIDRKSKQVWGFKEIWNGSSQFKYDWAPYDDIFPEAIWVHIIRSPFEFAMSCANWNKDPLDIDYLHNRLLDWVSIIKTSRKRADTGRYFEIHYEELVRDARGILQQVFDRVHITWHPNCEEALKKTALRSDMEVFVLTDADNALREIEKLVLAVEGLPELLNEFNYRIPDTLSKRLVGRDQRQDDKSTSTNLHDIQNQNMTRFHKPQYLHQQLYQQLIEKYNASEQQNHELGEKISQLLEQNRQLLEQIRQLEEGL